MQKMSGRLHEQGWEPETEIKMKKLHGSCEKDKKKKKKCKKKPVRVGVSASA